MSFKNPNKLKKKKKPIWNKDIPKGGSDAKKASGKSPKK